MSSELNSLFGRYWLLSFVFLSVVLYYIVDELVIDRLDSVKRMSTIGQSKAVATPSILQKQRVIPILSVEASEKEGSGISANSITSLMDNAKPMVVEPLFKRPANNIVQAKPKDDVIAMARRQINLTGLSSKGAYVNDTYYPIKSKLESIKVTTSDGGVHTAHLLSVTDNLALFSIKGQTFKVYLKK